MLDKTKGWVTYASAAGVIVITGLHGLGYLPDGAYDTLLAIFGGTGLGGLRRAINTNDGAIQQLQAQVSQAQTTLSTTGAIPPPPGKAS